MQGIHPVAGFKIFKTHKTKETKKSKNPLFVFHTVEDLKFQQK